jgi:hypothetical protein
VDDEAQAIAIERFKAKALEGKPLFADSPAHQLVT